MTHTPALYQHLRAPNDPSGNPRRVYMVYSADGAILDAIDEGYQGAPRWVRDLPQLPTFNITATEYKDILRTWSAKVAD